MPNLAQLQDTLQPFFHPNDSTVVCGALSAKQISAIKDAGVAVVINFLPDSELAFDEAAAVREAGMAYEQIAINGAEDLTQINMLEFDKILRKHHGKPTLMHCQSGNRVGAAVALRAGWLRGRKMDTALERGRSHGLAGLETEVTNRLLVPR